MAGHRFLSTAAAAAKLSWSLLQVLSGREMRGGVGVRVGCLLSFWVQKVQAVQHSPKMEGMEMPKRGKKFQKVKGQELC